MHQRKLAEAKAQRMLVRDELWARRRMHDVRIIETVTKAIYVNLVFSDCK